MSKLATASALALLLGTGCSVGGSPKARTSGLIASSAGFAAGTGMVAAAYGTDDHPALFWSGLALVVVSAVSLSATATRREPQQPEVAVPAAPITGTVRAPGLGPVVLR